MKKNLKILIIVGLALIAFTAFFRFGSFSSGALWSLSNEGNWILPLIGAAALVDSVNPCAFSILLLTIAFLFSVGKLRSRILYIGSFYILGIFLIYIMIGLGILQTLHLFNTPHFMAKLGAFILIALGLINVINEFCPRFPLKFKIPHFAHGKMAALVEKGSLPTAFLLGIFTGLCEFPCTGGPYLMVLGLLHDNATYIKGLIYLIIYNIIFILPLVIILLIASNKVLLEKVQTWQAQEKKFFRFGAGIAMVILGIAIFYL